jgi:hypothetical protein
MKASHDYKGVHLTLEMQSSEWTHLRGIPVRSPAIGSLDLPLVTSVGIARREGGILCKQLDNKAKFKQLSSIRLVRHGWQAADS